MKLKEEVSLQNLKIEMRVVLVHADKMWRELGHELVITSGTEEQEKHWAGSLHRFGYAVDLRIRYFDIETQKRIAVALQTVLGSAYTVIYEPTHIHVQFNQK